MSATQNLDRLPKWAREEILRLRREVEDLEKRLTVGPEDSNTFVRDYVHGHRPLGRHPIVRFALGEDPNPDDSIRHVDAYVERDRPHELVIMGGYSIQVAPQSGNVVRIQFTRPYR